MSDEDTRATFSCPACGVRRDHVVDSRGNEAGTLVRRRRECDACRHRWTTQERIESDLDAELWHTRAGEIAAELRTMAEALERW